MVNLGYNLSNIGTIYLLDTIEIICNSKSPINLLLNLENNVYTVISKKYNKNMKTIKSDIVKATNKMYDTKCLEDSKMKYQKLTPKTIIIDIVDKIINE